MMFSFSELKKIVSTHSRPKAAGIGSVAEPRISGVSTHSRPKAAGCHVANVAEGKKFQHTAARRRLVRHSIAFDFPCMFQHTAARRRLGSSFFSTNRRKMFQHTAARRRLAVPSVLGLSAKAVSTHSRPKAAG